MSFVGIVQWTWFKVRIYMSGNQGIIILHSAMCVCWNIIFKNFRRCNWRASFYGQYFFFIFKYRYLVVVCLRNDCAVRFLDTLKHLKLRSKFFVVKRWTSYATDFEVALVNHYNSKFLKCIFLGRHMLHAKKVKSLWFIKR